MRLLTSRSIPASTTISKLAEIFKVNSNYFYQDFDETNIFRYITEVLHNHYFKTELSQDNLHQEIVKWLKSPFLPSKTKFASNSIHTPDQLYCDENGTIKPEFKDFPITDKISNFWQTEFKFLYNDPQIIYFSEFSNKYSFEELLANKIHNHALFISNKMLLDALIESTANISEKMKEVIYDYRNGTQSYDAIIENTEIAISNLSTLLTSLKAGKNIDN